jgi:hypothetical protein
MCISPSQICVDGQRTEIPCRVCWQCQKSRVNDYVGRCIAEEKTSVATVAVTLTYAGNTPHAQTLVYSDVQKFLKIVRARIGPVRYICAGEYGSNKGRAHWHIILFFQGNPPTESRCECEEDAYCVCEHEPYSILFNRRFWWQAWPHGISYIQKPDYGAFKYVLKYILKDQTKEIAQGHLAMSKKPPLGYEHFMNLVDRAVEQRVLPRDASYSFRDVFDAKGKRRRYNLRGRMLELFVERFLIRWTVEHGHQPPVNDFLAGWLLKWERQNRKTFRDKLQRKPHSRPYYVETSHTVGKFVIEHLKGGLVRCYGLDTRVFKKPHHAVRYLLECDAPYADIERAFSQDDITLAYDARARDVEKNRNKEQRQKKWD